MAAVPCHNGTRAIRPLLSLAPQMSYGSKSDEIRLKAGLGLRGQLWRRSCCNVSLVQAMAVISGVDEKLPQQLWETSHRKRKQCMKNLLELMEDGKINLAIPGLPSCPKMSRLEYDCLSKRINSNPTYKVTYDDQVRFIVRLKPPGVDQQHRHRVCVEYEVLSYLHGKGLPVPKPYHLESRGGVIGTEFFIMEYVDGIILEDHSLPALQPAQRRTVYFSMMETIARLHRLPLGELELLLDPQKAHSDMRTFWNWLIQIREYNFTEACPSGNYDVEELFSKLKKLPPPQGRRKCIIHHDLNLDNFLFDRETFQVKALFDWETCCVGDPIVDLAQSCLPFTPVPPGILKDKPELAWLVAKPDVPGMPTEDELIAHYKQHSGLDFSERELGYAKTVVYLQFISSFLDASDERLRSNSREVVGFLTKAGYSYCPQN